jgi:H+/Cl- antiporter ClcA
MPETAPAPADASSIIRSRRFIGILVLAAIVGVVASLVAWLFLELIHELQGWVFTDLPKDLGFDKTPTWWYLPVLAIAGVITAFAVARLPGGGGHVPAEGLNAEPTRPIALPGVFLAALASIGLGVVLGPEAPLIAIGAGLGFIAVGLVRRDAPPELGPLIAAAGTFAAISFLFGSPLIAAVLLIEASGIGGERMPLLLVPGLIAAGIGSLVSIGMGAWTGVNTSAISIQLLDLPTFDRPDLTDFLWTFPLALAVAGVTFVIFWLANRGVGISNARPFVVLPAAGLVVAGLAIAFAEATDKGADQVLFSGQEQLGPLIAGAGTWSVSALLLVIAFKGAAYAISLASFRGGPVFPALFLGAAGGVLAAKLPGFELAPAVAVCMGAATVSVLRLPLSSVVLATVLTSSAGLGLEPLIIVGTVVAYLATLALPDVRAGLTESRLKVAA